MRLENTGYTPQNRDKLWLDPVDYMEEPREAVEFLAAHRLHMSICPSTATSCLCCRSGCGALPTCEGRGVKEQCGEFFASSTTLHSTHIRPLASIA